jgi:signal transduction histidine kinase
MKAFEILNKKILFFTFLAAFLLVSVIPLLIFGYHLLHRTEDELKSSLNENNYLITRHISNELDQFQIGKWISTLEGLSSSITTDENSVAAGNDAVINSYFSQVRELAILSIRTGHGSEAKHYVNQGFLSGWKGIRTTLLARLFQTGGDSLFAENGVILRNPIRIDTNQSVFLPVEIAFGGRTGRSGFIRGVFELTPVFGFIDAEMSSSRRQIYILDNRGRILFQNGRGRFEPGSVLPYPLRLPMPQSSAVFQTLKFRYEGRDYLGYMLPSQRTHWPVVVVYRHDEAYALVTQMRRRILGVIGFALISSVIMSFLFAWFHSSFIYHAKEVLQQYAQKLEQSNAELEAFSYSVTHELSAPLRHIMSYSDILEMRLTKTLDKKSMQQLNTISNAAKNLHELVYNILLFSRVGYADINKAKIDLRLIVRRIRARLDDEVPSRKISLKLGRSQPLWGDPVMIQQVVSNLVSNAVKFTRIRKRAVIKINAVLHGNEVIVSVRDNGIGFDMNDKNRLFGLFQRLHKKEEYEGSGVGLAHVRRIVAKHGGRTWAEGSPGKGAAFNFSLPVPKTRQGMDDGNPSID